MNRQMLRRVVAATQGAAVIDPQDTGLVLTATTTGAQTLTLQGMTVAAGKSVTVDWGDGSNNVYTAGAGIRTHAYAGAGTWVVTLTKRRDITLLDLRNTIIGGSISATNPLPANLTALLLWDCATLTCAISAAHPFPQSLLSLIVIGMFNRISWTVSQLAPMPPLIAELKIASTNIVWAAGVTNPLPSGLNFLYLQECNFVSVSTEQWGNIPNIRLIQYESSLGQASVDAILSAILANKANFAWATPTLDLLGGSNAAPSGTYQAMDPATTGNEKKYALVNGNGSYAPGPEWVVQTA